MSRIDPIIAVLVAPDDDDPPGLAGLADVGAEVRIARSAAELRSAVAGADVLAVYDFRTPLVCELGARAKELAWIHAASAGVDAVLTPAVVEAPTIVTNAQGVFDDAIAEYVLATLLLFAKDLRATIDRQREHRWEHRETERLAGRHVLVVGAGSIGTAIARACAAMGMVVRGVARSPRHADHFEAVVGVEDLHAELGRADDVVVATPLTPATHGLIDAAALGAMQQGARLVNIGRGPVVDQEALLDALRRGHVGAAALDVFGEEPLPADHPFWDMEQVLVSPHMSGDVVGWVESLGAQFVANVERWQRGEDLHHVVEKRAMAGAAK